MRRSLLFCATRRLVSWYLLTVRYGLGVDQTNVATVVLPEKLDEMIYMEQPQEFNDGNGWVCLLKKYLYGLKQASSVWNQRLDMAWTSFGLKMSKYDAAVHEDDLLKDFGEAKEVCVLLDQK